MRWLKRTSDKCDVPVIKTARFAAGSRVEVHGSSGEDIDVRENKDGDNQQDHESGHQAVTVVVNVVTGGSGSGGKLLLAFAVSLAASLVAAALEALGIIDITPL